MKIATKKDYEEYLNESIKPDYESEEWIIGGKWRNTYYYNRYGTALRKHAPIDFNVGFNEWLREKS